VEIRDIKSGLLRVGHLRPKLIRTLVRDISAFFSRDISADIMVDISADISKGH
jgi:hypothetical protein